MPFTTLLKLDNDHFSLTANKHLYNDTRLQKLVNSFYLYRLDFMQAYFDAVNIDCNCDGGYKCYPVIATNSAYENRNVIGQLLAHFDIEMIKCKKEIEILFG